MKPVTTLFGLILSLLGPQPDAPKELQLRPGDQIVAIGDSITQAGGYLRLMNAVFAQQYSDLKIPPIINVGIGGQKAEDLVVRFDKDVVQRKPAIVTISIGINDVWHRMKAPPDPKVLAAYKENLEKMVKMAQAAGIRVYLLAPTVIEEDRKAEGNIRLKDYVAAGKEVAEQNECVYVDLQAQMFKAIAAWRQRHPVHAPASTKPINTFTTDGVHMTSMGDAVMAVGILRAMGVSDEKIRATDTSKMFQDRKPARKTAPASRPAATTK